MRLTGAIIIFAWGGYCGVFVKNMLPNNGHQQ